jgi:flagellar motility protein MotE (MotC chaperone)
MLSAALSQRLWARSRRARVAFSVAVVLLVCPAVAQDGQAPVKEKPKGAANKTPEKVAADKPPDVEASRFCANAAPSITEARIAWETRQLSELDAQVKQRLARSRKSGSFGERMGR